MILIGSPAELPNPSRMTREIACEYSASCPQSSGKEMDNPMKIVTIIGTRPQFIKYAPVSRVLRDVHEEILVHTGQHYDPELSDIFFRDLSIPRPAYNLEAGSGPHGEQTGKILQRAEEVLVREDPDLVMVYGDTNSTLGGAMAAAKLRIPLAHVEAGLRSFDRTMPEEINRVVTDHVSDILFCPTQQAVNNLRNEGIRAGLHPVGDVMADALAYGRKNARQQSRIIKKLGLAKKEYYVLTIHRPGNTGSRRTLMTILTAVGKAGRTVVFPVHPRTEKSLKEFGLLEMISSDIILTEPLGYLDMIQLMEGAQRILTDSGGMQKEAYILGVPCVTFRENTEWVETLEGGWNVLAGTDPARIAAALRTKVPDTPHPDLYPVGASVKIGAVLNSFGGR